MINSDQMKHTYYSKGVTQQPHQYIVYPIWQQSRLVFAYTNGHKGAECHPAIDCPKHLAPVVAIRQWLWQVLEKEQVPASSCSASVQLARDLGILLSRVVIVHHKEHIVSQQQYVDMHCPPERAYHLPVEEMAVALCNVLGIV